MEYRILPFPRWILLTALLAGSACSRQADGTAGAAADGATGDPAAQPAPAAGLASAPLPAPAPASAAASVPDGSDLVASTGTHTEGPGGSSLTVGAPSANGTLPGGLPRNSGPPRVPDDMVLARVNGTEIRGTEFNRVLASSWKRATSEGMVVPPEEQGRLMGTVLNSMLASELLRQSAVARGIAPDPKTIDEQFDALRAHAPSADAFDASLARSGYTPASLRSEIQARYLVATLTDQIRNQHASEIATSDAEAKAMYDHDPRVFNRPERVHARHILRKVPRGATAQAMAVERGKIEEALAQLQAGVDFAQVARQYSTDTTAAYGGELGVFPRGAMVASFDEAVFALQPMAISGIIETPAGYHIVQVLEHMPAGIAPFDEVKTQIIQRTTEMKFQRLMSDEINTLAASARVDVAAPAAPPGGVPVAAPGSMPVVPATPVSGQ